MEIKLTPKESEIYFYNALCNGINYMSGYGLQFDYKDRDYKEAKRFLQSQIDLGEVPHYMHYPDYMKKKGEKPTICREDVWLEMLLIGKKLKMIDQEGKGEYTREIGIKEIHERVQKTQLNHLQDMIDENDDAITADVILQTVFFEDIIFG